MRKRCRLNSAAGIALFFVACAGALAAEPGGSEFFEAKIRPVLAQRCYTCHSATAKKLKAGLRLDSVEGILRGGESGPAVVPGKPDDSLLISAIHYEEGGLQMPPKGKLPPEQISDFEAWIKMGAPLPKPAVAAATPATRPSAMSLAQGRTFWSFQPPREPHVPEVSNAQWSRNSIDRFVFEKLKENGLSPSPPIDKRLLIRRATFDLIGLPPTNAETDAFLADQSPDAFEKVVDRLLASPHYGERWGRYWLDVARYADTKGYVFQEERRYAFAYTYRDWVIRSLNEDLPYDQFLIQQIAADCMDLKDDNRPLAALGFLTLGRRFLNNPPDIIDDRIDVVTRGTMALTVSCARCHDHKYDPIPTADYYSLYGIFASSTEPAELPLLGKTDAAAPQVAEFEAQKKKLLDEVQAYLQKRRDEVIAESLKPPKLAGYLMLAAQFPQADEASLSKAAQERGLHVQIALRWRDYLKSSDNSALIPLEAIVQRSPLRLRTPVNPLIWSDLSNAPPHDPMEIATRLAGLLIRFDSPSPRANPAEESLRRLLRDPQSPANFPVAQAEQLFDGNDTGQLAQRRQAVDELIATHPGSPPRAMAMRELPQPVEPHIFVRGNPANPGKQVPRQFPAILSPDDRKPFLHGSGRLELAKAIASKDNPLTARVIVNRVWQHHFGFGLVRSAGDFGTRGEPPTHPELLDWLALRFVNDDGWSLKKLHRRIMLSATYQQASASVDPIARAKDPENRLLSHQNARRLDLEAMRDSLLMASGQLDLTVGGRSVDILAEPFVPRRTLYAFIDRQNLPGFFRTFDLASPDSTSARRFNTSVPQQALYMMNSPFVIEQVRKLAARQTPAETDPARRIARLYRQVLGRDPSAAEMKLGQDFVKAEESHSAIASAGRSRWSYGFGQLDEARQKTLTFTPLPHWTGSAWQGGAALPDQATGWASLGSGGGHPGDATHAVIRRWTAPRDCTVSISGELSHASDQGDGVRAYVVTSREGALGSWTVRHKQADTRISGIAVKPGDTIDFIVDCGRAGDVTYDGFSWSIRITKQAAPQPVAGDDTGSGWDSVAEFAGPGPAPLSAWEKYAQVLLESNEFAFVD
jgi:hypothetical protein